jgi:hypothetical protein
MLLPYSQLVFSNERKYLAFIKRHFKSSSLSSLNWIGAIFSIFISLMFKTLAGAASEGPHQSSTAIGGAMEVFSARNPRIIANIKIKTLVIITATSFIVAIPKKRENLTRKIVTNCRGVAQFVHLCTHTKSSGYWLISILNNTCYLQSLDTKSQGICIIV